MATAPQPPSHTAVELVLDAALELFSSNGFGATSMREIAEASGVSVGNIYHHFHGKEAIFDRLIERYWECLLDPGLKLTALFSRADFPDDLEQLAEAVEEVVDAHPQEILLIYVDVIEFRGEHVRAFYQGMADRFAAAYSESLARQQELGRFGDVDPLVAVMVAVRWLFYFYTVERCFGVPMHFGMRPEEAVGEFIKMLRYGVLARSTEAGQDGRVEDTPGGRRP